MAAKPITLSGVMFPKGKAGGDKPVPCVIVAYAWATGLEVGGGPVYPPEVELPPGTPEHPIILPPTDAHPEHPIVLPEPPESPPEIPTDPGAVKPPPPEGGWAWNPAWGWGYYPGPGQPGPKRGR